MPSSSQSEGIFRIKAMEALAKIGDRVGFPILDYLPGQKFFHCLSLRANTGPIKNIRIYRLLIKKFLKLSHEHVASYKIDVNHIDFLRDLFNKVILFDFKQ